MYNVWSILSKLVINRERVIEMIDKIIELKKELERLQKINKKCLKDYEKDNKNINALKGLYLSRGKIEILNYILY
jgi:uncharacterized membrane protein (DUF106 family)